MRCSQLSRHTALAGLACLIFALPAAAGSLPADALPIPNRLAAAEMVVLGKVTSFEDKPVSAPTFPGAKDKAEFKIAVIAVSDTLLAPQETKTVRLGFVPPPPNVLISPPPFQATVGQEGCFFLTKNSQGDFQQVSGPLGFLDKNSPTFGKDVALIKRCLKLLEDPNASLESKKIEDRFLTAAMLVARYRTRKSSAETEPIDAGQSKLILQALADADWTPASDITQLTPMMVLNRLPLTEKDGWTPPPAFKDPKAYAAYAQQWLKDHAGSYRIQKFVVEKK